MDQVRHLADMPWATGATAAVRGGGLHAVTMARLTQRDFRAALHFLAGLSGRGGLEEFAAYVTTALPRLIPCEVTSVGLVDIRSGTMRFVENPKTSSPADIETLMRLAPENPFLRHVATTADREARRLSDLLTRVQIHRLPLYNEFFRKLGGEHVMGAALESSDGLSLARDRRDFSEQERIILTLLRPHLIQGHRTARAWDRLRADLALVFRGADAGGVAALAVLSDTGRLRLASPRAAALLTIYFGRQRRRDRLPEPLGSWVQHHRAAARDPSELPPLRAPFVIEGTTARLVVRLLAETPDPLLLLEEQVTRRDPVKLRKLGLGPREAEVLAWVVEGRTTPEIATILGLSPRTVQTYLARVFDKLGVETRAAAAARAVEVMLAMPSE